MFQQGSPLSSAKNQGPAVVGGVWVVSGSPGEWVPRGVSGLSLQTQSSDCKAEVFFLLVSASWRDWSRGWWGLLAKGASARPSVGGAESSLRWARSCLRACLEGAVDSGNL